jgi:hypothetical protein
MAEWSMAVVLKTDQAGLSNSRFSRKVRTLRKIALDDRILSRGVLTVPF